MAGIGVLFAITGTFLRKVLNFKHAAVASIRKSIICFNDVMILEKMIIGFTFGL